MNIKDYSRKPLREEKLEALKTEEQFNNGKKDTVVKKKEKKHEISVIKKEEKIKTDTSFSEIEAIAINTPAADSLVSQPKKKKEVRFKLFSRAAIPEPLNSLANQ